MFKRLSTPNKPKTNYTSHINKGFTLIEVLVAILILAVAMTAVIESFTSLSRNSLNLRNHHLAYLVAKNYLTIERITPTSELNKISSSQTKMGGKNWYIDSYAEPTIFPLVEKVLIEVFENKNDTEPLVRFNGYRAKQK